MKKVGNFVDDIKGKAIEAKAVVALISPAYMESAFCLTELGVDYVLKADRFPLVVPPNTFAVRGTNSSSSCLYFARDNIVLK